MLLLFILKIHWRVIYFMTDSRECLSRSSIFPPFLFFIFFVALLLRLFPNTYIPYIYFPLSSIIFIFIISLILISPVYCSVSLSHHFRIISLPLVSFPLLSPWSYSHKIVILWAYLISPSLFPSVYLFFSLSLSLGLFFPNSFAFT